VFHHPTQDAYVEYIALGDVALVARVFELADGIDDLVERNELYFAIGEALERWAADPLKRAICAELDVDEQDEWLEGVEQRATLRALERELADA
jgi:hypothetical protein